MTAPYCVRLSAAKKLRAARTVKLAKSSTLEMSWSMPDRLYSHLTSSAFASEVRPRSLAPNQSRTALANNTGNPLNDC